MAMMDPIWSNVLALRFIPNVAHDLAKELQLKPYQKSISMFTCDIDDVGYTAVDEATKKADVEVVYASSFYAGATHPSGPLSGEFIGILAGPDPAETKAGLAAAIRLIEEDACFYAADPEGEIAFYAFTVSRTGSFLSNWAGIREGCPLAYLIAPPLESIYGIDAALKAADVKMGRWFGPPTETNFGGGLLSGTQSACKAAAEAFCNKVLEVAARPKEFSG